MSGVGLESPTYVRLFIQSDKLRSVSASRLRTKEPPRGSLLLDKIEASGRRDFVPLLLAWSAIDYARVRARIGSVIRALGT